MILESTITCPECGEKTQESMPENACIYFYRCDRCHEMLKPKKGDCCVFCSYGDMPCPQVQLVGSSCCGEFTS